MVPYTVTLSARQRIGSRAAILWIAAVLLLPVLGCGEGASTGLLPASFIADSTECFVPTEAEEWAARVIDLTNEERLAVGLPPLATNTLLARIAGDYACEMIENDFFDHVSPVTGSTVGSRALQYGYFFRKVGENLAGGQTSPEQVISEWMNSEGHRANILDEDFIEIGVSVRAGGYYKWYWVQEYGLPR